MSSVFVYRNEELGHVGLGSIFVLGNPAPQRARFLAPGDKLGKYDLIRQIAIGGMAELYLARTVGIEGFEKLVVVKRILPQYLDNASFVDMFLNEARLAATFHHPNIAQVYDIGQEMGEYFFSMEYVHGEDLGRLVASATENGIPISLDVALTVVAGLCAGLHHAHEKASPDGKPLNVVHRDVSPSNVLVSYDGGVKLVDFGIARVNTTPHSTHNGLKGKIAYMSPEQCRGNKTRLDRRSDVFSAGTILYELTTGQLPFSDDSEYAVLNMIVNRDADPPSKLVPSYPRALEAIVMRALARDPRQRYATALELQTAIEDFAHENRLRVSPLVLARLMGTLFPARLEEWDHARAQGAFFVEQHVVRTLIESGKTGENAAAPPSEDSVTERQSIADEDRPTSIHTPVPPLQVIAPRSNQTLRLPTPVARAPGAVPGMPGAVPIYVPPLVPPQPGTLVSNPLGHGVVDTRGVGDVTERDQAPDPTSLVQAPRTRNPLLIVAVAGAATALVLMFVIARGGDSPRAAQVAPEPAAVVTPSPAPAPTPPKPAPEEITMDPEPARPPEKAPEQTAPIHEAVVAPVEPDPKPDPKPDPVKPKPDPVKPAIKTVRADPVAPKPPGKKPDPVKVAKTRPAKVKPHVDVKPAPTTKPVDKSEPKPEPKDPQWNTDSPFMPVRPDKR